MNCQEAATLLKKNIEQVMVDSEQSRNLIMMSLLAGGHILLEDVPGTGKTTLAKAVAQSLNLSFKRVQFTPDLMPSDLIGIQFYNQAKENLSSAKVRCLLSWCWRMKLTALPAHAIELVGSDGRTSDQRGRHDLSVAGAVFRHRDAEPD